MLAARQRAAVRKFVRLVAKETFNADIGRGESFERHRDLQPHCVAEDERAHGIF